MFVCTGIRFEKIDHRRPTPDPSSLGLGQRHGRSRGGWTNGHSRRVASHRVAFPLRKYAPLSLLNIVLDDLLIDESTSEAIRTTKSGVQCLKQLRTLSLFRNSSFGGLGK